MTTVLKKELKSIPKFKWSAGLKLMANRVRKNSVKSVKIGTLKSSIVSFANKFISMIKI